MPKTVALGDHFEKFITDQVAAGRFNNDSEVVRAGLRLLEEHELKLRELRALIDEGDRALAAGQTTTVTDPAAYAASVVARGRARQTRRTPA
jgi:antitoxin ParD1/3/4